MRQIPQSELEHARSVVADHLPGAADVKRAANMVLLERRAAALAERAACIGWLRQWGPEDLCSQLADDLERSRAAEDRRG
jgi:hypothetical protein